MKSISLLLVTLLGVGCPARGLAEQPVEDMIEALREDDLATARAAQEMLFKMGPKAVLPLRRALGDPNFFVRLRAAETLGRLGPESRSAAPELVGLLRDPKFEVHTAAEAALVAIGEPVIGALSSALKREEEAVRKSLLQTLVKLGQASTPILLQTLKSDPSSFVRAGAAEALASLAPPQASAVLGLMNALDDLEEGVRAQVVDTLTQWGETAKPAIGKLAVLSLTDKDPLVKQRSLGALTRIGRATKESLPGLIAAYSHPDPEVRRNILAVVGASEISFQDAAPLLQTAMRDADAGARLNAVQDVGLLGKQTAESLPVLQTALSDAQPQIRSAAILELGRLKEGTTEAATLLSQALKEPNPALRREIIQALGSLGAAGVPGLILELRDTYSLLGEEAAQMIVRIGPAALPVLETAEGVSDPLTRKKISEIMKHIKNKRPSFRSRR